MADAAAGPDGSTTMRAVLADAHIHLFRDGFRGAQNPVAGVTDELAVYRELRARHGIARALVVGFEGELRHHDNNRHLARLAAAEPWTAPVAYLPVWPAPRPDVLERLAADGFVGVACWVQSVEDAERLDAWPADTLQTVGRLFRVVSLNARGAVTGRLTRAVAAMAPAQVLFSHLGLPGRHHDIPSAGEVRDRLHGLLALSGHRHVGVKASGLYALCEDCADPYAIAVPYLTEIIDSFGVGRVCWGSDFVPVLARMPFERAVTIPLSVTDDERRMIMGGNLLRVLTAPNAP